MEQSPTVLRRTMSMKTLISRSKGKTAAAAVSAAVAMEVDPPSTQKTEKTGSKRRLSSILSLLSPLSGRKKHEKNKEARKEETVAPSPSPSPPKKESRTQRLRSMTMRINGALKEWAPLRGDEYLHKRDAPTEDWEVGRSSLDRKRAFREEEMAVDENPALSVAPYATCRLLSREDISSAFDVLCSSNQTTPSQSPSMVGGKKQRTDDHPSYLSSGFATISTSTPPRLTRAATETIITLRKTAPRRSPLSKNLFDAPVTPAPQPVPQLIPSYQSVPTPYSTPFDSPAHITPLSSALSTPVSSSSCSPALSAPSSPSSMNSMKSFPSEPALVPPPLPPATYEQFAPASSKRKSMRKTLSRAIGEFFGTSVKTRGSSARPKIPDSMMPQSERGAQGDQEFEDLVRAASTLI